MDFQFLSILLGSSLASGINVYLTVVILGIAQRMNWVDLPGAMDTFAHPLIILLAFVMFVIEFFADKIPYVDSTWDAVHTFIRPIGGALVGYFSMGEAGQLVQTATALMTGGVALEAHAVKASTRAAINASPEPITNIVASVAEDISIVVLMYLIIQRPIIASFVVIGLIIGAVLVLKFFFKFFGQIFKSKPSKSVPQSV